MPIPGQRDREKSRRDLTVWLRGKLPGANDVELSELSGPAFTGFSNETILFDATWKQDGREHSQGFAIRVQPTDHTIFLESAFDTQYLVIKAIGEQTDIPVPAVRWFESDPDVLGAPFFVMDKVAGDVPCDNPPYTLGGWPAGATPQQQEQLWWDALDVMARIHRLDWRALGLGLVDRPERGKTGLDQQLSYYQSYFDWAAQDRPQPSVQAAWDRLLTTRPESTGPDALCWGDSRIGNMIFEDFRCRAVLDWEMVTPGDPVQDLAWWLFLDRHHSEGLGAPRLPGFPTREATIARWEELTGRRAAHLDWYELWAAFRFGVVMIRISRLMIHFELMPPDSDQERNNAVTRLIDRLLGRADISPTL